MILDFEHTRSAAESLPMDRFHKPFGASDRTVSRTDCGNLKSENAVTENFPPLSPKTPPLNESTVLNSPGPSGREGDKVSMFSWMPGHATDIEQEALQLGVERTGPFFHRPTKQTIMQDVIEIDISNCRNAGDASEVSPSQLKEAQKHSVVLGGKAEASLQSCVHEAHPPGMHTCSHSRQPQHSISQRRGQLDNCRLTLCSSGCDSDGAAGRCDTDRSEQAAHVHEPYTLTAVAHSLGGAALLIYVVQFKRTNRRHRLSRLVLLSPAGFMESIPSAVKPLALIIPAALRLITWMFPAIVSLPFYVPSSMLRSLMFRLTADVSSIPALAKLVRCASEPLRLDCMSHAYLATFVHIVLTDDRIVSQGMGSTMYKW